MALIQKGYNCTDCTMVGCSHKENTSGYTCGMFRVKQEVTGYSITVEYNGTYPNMIGGELTIYVDGRRVYEKQHCCKPNPPIPYSTENQYRMSSYLTWEETGIFTEKVDKLVEKVLKMVKIHGEEGTKLLVRMEQE